MKFYELLNKYSNIEILTSLNKYYKEINSEAYLCALNELRDLKPSEIIQDIEIHVSLAKDTDDVDEYLCCDGLGPDPDENNEIVRWGLEYDDWEEWLAKDIDKESLANLDEITILAAIMWELTFNGYSQENLKEKQNELQERLSEADNQENWIKVDLEDLDI